MYDKYTLWIRIEIDGLICYHTFLYKSIDPNVYILVFLMFLLISTNNYLRHVILCFSYISSLLNVNEFAVKNIYIYSTAKDAIKNQTYIYYEQKNIKITHKGIDH